jgi:hypothetical protein
VGIRSATRGRTINEDQWESTVGECGGHEVRPQLFQAGLEERWRGCSCSTLLWTPDQGSTSVDDARRDPNEALKEQEVEDAEDAGSVLEIC